jgi:hypothetical protein
VDSQEEHIVWNVEIVYGQWIVRDWGSINSRRYEGDHMWDEHRGEGGRE